VPAPSPTTSPLGPNWADKAEVAQLAARVDELENAIDTSVTVEPPKADPETFQVAPLAPDGQQTPAPERSGASDGTGLAPAGEELPEGEKKGYFKGW
jgi:hypothetical protein